MSLCSTNGILSDTVLILAAGGSSSRFKRGNKLLQDLNGLPIFLHAVRTAAPLLRKRNIFMAVPRSEEDVFRMIQKQYLPDVEVVFPADKEAKVFMQYNNIVHTPGQKTPDMKFTEADPVLDTAVEILTGKVSLEEAKETSKKAAEERKAKKTDKKASPKTDDKKAGKKEASK